MVALVVLLRGTGSGEVGDPRFRLPDRCRAAAPLVNEGILLKVAANPLSCIHHNIQNWDGIPVVAR